MPRWPHVGIPFYTGIRNFISFYCKAYWNKRYRSFWTLLPLYCICRRYGVFSERCTMHWNLVEIFNTFPLSFGLKPNLTIVALKGVQVALCGMRCIELCNETIKILGTYFLYISRIKEECNLLKIVSNEQSVLNLWRYRNLTLEGQIVVSKNLEISKIAFQDSTSPNSRM